MYHHCIHLFLLLQVLRASGRIFFHERSHVTLTPTSGGQDTFGFSMAYQNLKKNLVTGAPHSDQIGKIFNCPLSEVLMNKTIGCNEALIDVDKLAPYDREYAPSIMLNLGYSVSATDEYFLSCAPLWTEMVTHYLGTCFIYNDTAQNFKTSVEHRNESSLIGNGCRTFVDNDWLMIAASPDVTYAASDALAPVESMRYKSENGIPTAVGNYLGGFLNLGFSFASGQFFSNETIYAISALDSKTTKGVIHFIEPDKSGQKLSLLKQTDSTYVTIKEDDSVGSMFGAAMCSANLNGDERSDLVVGAPAWGDKDEGSFDTGALHIYLGGQKFQKMYEVYRRHRVIIGTEDGSRLGSAVAASDLDGDYLSEIFVSAPYENSGEGALYIFSGYEINKLLMDTEQYKKISMSELKLTQRIQNRKFKAFGYSLQVIPDLDENGCDELAVGSPMSNNIMVLRCLPSVNVTVKARLKDRQLKMEDKNFAIIVCVNVEDWKDRSFYLPFILKNEVKGNGVSINSDQTTVNLEVKNKENCTEVTVKLDDLTPGEYVFHTSVSMDEDRIKNSEVFDLSWGVISPRTHDKLSARVDVSRRCRGSDCDPIFAMEIKWNGGFITADSYELGSSESLTARLEITNTGKISWEACAMLTVTGAMVSQIGCTETNGQYKCLLPKGFLPNTMYAIDVKLDMSRPKNVDEKIQMDVELRYFCDDLTKTINHKSAQLKLNLNTTDIILTRKCRDQYISDQIIQDINSEQLEDAHEYWIENKGKIYWSNVNAHLIVHKAPFIQSSRVLNWASEDYPDRTEFIHNFDLLPESKQKIITSIYIIKRKIMENLNDDKLTVESSFVLYLPPTSETKQTRLTSNIILQNELQFGQNKNLMIFLGILLALIAMAVVIFVLYKMQFFKSAERTKLEQLKQAQLNRHGSTTQRGSVSAMEIEELEMEVDDEAFEVVDMSTPVLQKDTEL